MEIILNIPHSSDKGVYLFGWKKDVVKHVNMWTDWFTDVIFDRENVISHIFGLSRFVCDAERLDNDPMESIGQGILYRYFEDSQRATLDDSTKRYLMDARKKHLEGISKSLEKAENPILIDCHSFPRVYDDVDVCIGFNKDWSKPKKNVIESVCDIFREHGYSVGINTPFSNSLTPKCNKKYPSMMIELNKRVYMCGNLKMDVEKSAKIKTAIDDVYAFLGSL